ncbi:uncharacterized protein LOC133907430 [Phragmites australis]|uniref:uncharacterized protein LOC133907430 n=1 Tax=Phragmites australis TaxID=29695 RepID=UPI002D79DED5|nr:uncharacterized protein LOC133907430 [Phragmites australis]
MNASRTLVSLSLLYLCAVTLLLSSASAEPALLSPAAAGDRWPADSPAGTPMAVEVTLGGTEDDAAAADVVADGIAVPPLGRQRFRPRHPSALSPEARRGLEHEARCGPRVPVPRGFPWPGWKPRCCGRGDATVAPGVQQLLPTYDEP